MLLTPADIAALSRLFDEAHELEPAAREAWLTGLHARLPATQAHLVAPLREMLMAGDETAGRGPLATLPRLVDAEPAPNDAAMHGQHVGPYRVLSAIGHGGMGSVWLAERCDGAFERQVALKLPRLAWAPGLAARMAREQRIAARLEHPAIARMYDAGIDGMGRPYIAMARIDGVPIDVFVRQQGLDVPSTVRLMVQVIRAVAYAHGRLVVHRDLKPSNVLVDRAGQVHLLDFGIATLLQDDAEWGSQERLTLDQSQAMTPAYASPEQLRGDTATVQTDVYSLGVMLYELLTGALPFHDARRGAATARGEPAAPSRVAAPDSRSRALRGDFDTIVCKALKAEPRDRYVTADALADDLERCLRDEPILARPDHLLYRWTKALRRRWREVAVATAAGLALLGGTAVALVQQQRADHAAARQRLVVDYVAEVFRLRKRPGAPMALPVGDALLHQGAQLVAGRFASEPDMQAQMYGVIADLFMELGAYREAADYAQRRLDLVRAPRGAPPELWPALTQAATALTLAHRGKQAESLARQALEVAGADQSRRVEALSILGLALQRQGRYADSAAVADEIETLAPGLAQPTLAVAWGHTLRGSKHGVEGRLSEARTWYEMGMRLARQIEGEHSLAAAEMQRHMGWHLLQHDDVDAALVELQASFDASQRHGGVGAVHGAVLHALDWSWLLLRGAVDHARALQAIEHAQAAIAGLDIVPDRLRHRVAIDRGIVATIWGDLDEASRVLTPTAPHVTSAMQADPPTRIQLAQVMTMLTLMRGDAAAAEHWLDQAVRARNDMQGNADTWAVWDHLVRSRNLSMAGRHEEALATLQPLTRADTLPKGMDASVVTGDELRVARARALADAGHVQAAWQLLGDPPVRALERDKWGVLSPTALRAELLCQRGRPADGRALLDAEIQATSARRFAHAPALASLRAHAGLCALRAGDRKAAARLAREAGASFTAQPTVSPYYKAPWLSLETALGIQRRPR